MNSLMPANTTRPLLLAPTAAISFLSEEDTLKLKELERKVENSFLETSRALCEIKNYKDGLFWKGRFNSFADYVKERFNYQAQHAYRLAAAGEFVKQIESHNSSSSTKSPCLRRKSRFATSSAKSLKTNGSSAGKESLEKPLLPN
jgi:hypothetical protein